MHSKYPWPASRLSVKEMAMLYEARLKLNKPITELLRLAVEDSYNAKTKGDVKHVS